jgi:hypothetical protein
MNWRGTTDGLIIVALVLAITYNVAARVFGGVDSTISVAVQEACQRWPVIALGVGFVLGHIFWPVK